MAVKKTDGERNFRLFLRFKHDLEVCLQAF